jgi:ribosomal protein S24E
VKVEITNKQKNVLFNREEIEFSVEEAATTPARKDLREKIAALTNAKTELVIIGKINNAFGSKAVNGTARVYANEADLKKTELPQIIGRNIGQKRKGKKAGKAKGQKPEATAPTAKPAEKK